MIGSPEVNKILRRVLIPVLRQHGFTKTENRHNWGWHGPCTWVLDIRAVGGYFSGVTGWPPMSVGVWLGVFYDFIPEEIPDTVKRSSDDLPLPREYDCHLRSQVNCSLNQSKFTRSLSNPAERKRSDLWWIEPNGSNVEDVAEDIARQFLTEGLPWFERITDLNAAYEEIQQERDCYHKFIRAAAFAKHLGYNEANREYAKRLRQEAERIGKG
jgi:hypothetical protein